MSTQIRPYDKQDLAALLSVWENATRLAHPFMTEAFIEQERENIPNRYLPNADSWVILEQNQLVGFIALIGNEVGALFVAPERHRQGYGSALMNHAKGLHKSLDVEVFEANHIGRAFYARCGFESHNTNIHEDTQQRVLRLACIVR